MAQTYAIRSGQSGRERLRVLSYVLQAGTFDFLDKVGVRPRMGCLDVGCGGGDVTRELARRVGAAGRVVGLDMDAAQLQIVRAETAAQNIHNIDYRVADVTNPPSDLGNFDLIYTRFLFERGELDPMPLQIAHLRSLQLGFYCRLDWMSSFTARMARRSIIWINRLCEA